MQGYEVKQGSTAYPLTFLLVSATDHITGLTGATPTVTIRKVGGAFAAPAGAVTEIANGWYQVAGNATDTATLGPLLLHATATGADPTDIIFPVVAVDPQDGAKYGLTALTNPVLTPAQVANAVWADATAGDFTTAGTPGKVLVGQLGGAFTSGTSVYTAASLANAPTGSGGGGVTYPPNFSTLAIDTSGRVALGVNGLDALVTTPPTGAATTWPQLMLQLARRFTKRVVKNATSKTITLYADDQTTVVGTLPYTDDGAGNETQGPLA